MADKKNPLYFTASGSGDMSARIDFDGMNRFIGEQGMHHYNARIADIKGASLRYQKDRESCEIKVYHPVNKDVEGDSCSVAVIDLYGLKLDWVSGGVIKFTALLTGLSHYAEGEEMAEDPYGGFNYLPPRITSGLFPIPVSITLWPTKGEDDDD